MRSLEGIIEIVNHRTGSGTKRPSQSGVPGTAAERSEFVQVFRYLVVGGLNTTFGYGSFALLNYLLTGHLPYAYMFANVAANVFSITFAFLGYKFFVFKTKGNFWREYLRTYAVYGTSMLIGLALLPTLVFLLGFAIHNAALVPYVAQAVCTALVVLGSYFGHKRFSFRT